MKTITKSELIEQLELAQQEAQQLKERQIILAAISAILLIQSIL